MLPERNNYAAPGLFGRRRPFKFLSGFREVLERSCLWIAPRCAVGVAPERDLF